VSALGNVSRLVVELCPSVKDVSGLGNVHHLSLAGIHNQATGFSSLGNVHELNLYFIDNLRDEDLIAFPLVSATFALATGLFLLAASFFEVLAEAFTCFVAMRTLRSF
jgi:hypothetical protein